MLPVPPVAVDGVELVRAGVTWLPGKPCPIAAGSACANSGATQRARWLAELPSHWLARASVSLKQSSMGEEVQPAPG